jgi:hypothetical protein
MKIIRKKKMNTEEYSIQELWATIKRQNLRIHMVKGKGAEIQTEGLRNPFNKIIAEISQIYLII